MIEAPSNSGARQRSSDGLWEWTGTEWMPAQPPPGPSQVAQSTPVVQTAPPAQAAAPSVQTAPPAQGNPVSPDGKHQWNGTSWMPVKKKGHLVRNISIVVGMLLLVGIGFAIANSGGSNKNSAAGTTASSPAVTAVPTAQATPAPTAKATVAPTAKATVAPTAPAAPALTAQQQNAVRAAQDYLSFMAFSRQGIIDQLSSSAGDGYPVKDATIAVDSLHVDWNAEAVQAAKEYLQTMPFSCAGLIAQLDSRYGGQFTVAQATYGAHQAGAC